MTEAEKLAATTKFAAAMGWCLCPNGAHSDYCFFDDLRRHHEFNPWANPADAIELAGTVAPGGYELAWWPKSDVDTPYCVKLLAHANPVALGSTLCDAICLAVLECLKADEKDTP